MPLETSKDECESIFMIKSTDSDKFDSKFPHLPNQAHCVTFILYYNQNKNMKALIGESL